MENNYSFLRPKLLKYLFRYCFAGFLLLSAYSRVVAQSASTTATTLSNAYLFVENLDKFPSNDHFVFSKIQVPWSRDGKTYNANHDSLTVRIHNKGINNLIIKSLVLSNNTTWKFVKLKGADYSSASLPLTIGSGTYADLTVKFVALDAATRVKVLHDTLTIVSNDVKFPSKAIYLDGLWQKKGESVNEPSTQDIINTFGFKTKTGYGLTDPDKGDSTKLKGDEIKPSYFVRADASLPVSVTQMAAYHACCTFTEKLTWFPKGKDTLISITTHFGVDAQSLLPRKARPNIVAAGVLNPTTAFGFNVGSRNTTDASKNPGRKIGIRVWKAYDSKGRIIPNSYIIGNDYLGTSGTNYDYNDNMYFIKNVRPEKGSAFYSALRASPSALDFGQKLLASSNSLQLSLASLGKTYTDGSKDPAITISSISIVGVNKSEFTATMPVKTTLNPQESTTLNVGFKPASQGLKIADLLIYYNNSQSPLRVPLYGIAKASGTTVTANYRVNSGSSTSLTINGKTWSADNKYSFDNLEPYSNSSLKQIACTDEDALYLREQSSNGDKKPFRYEFPVTNGDYVVRLHFAELYWGAPGSGFEGGPGSRVMSVSLENQLRLINLDVSHEVGGATALVKNIPVTVNDGKLNINFSATVNRPMVVAVEVYSFRSSSARPADIVATESELNQVRVYPIPVEKMLNIKFPAEYHGSTNLQMVDAMGRTYEVAKFNLQAGGSSQEVNISNLSLKPGFYYLRIVSATKTDMIKLIVK
ncbi:malectin domain-containing carbohydrate-binding protein [Segetibacter koreensis]|uniref:malectin domain-containing carbohydrate-binding protein n=1 Tax=Segetibacter koreensis TaxID=398037 RepID=UPI00037A20CD|nr:malectin domain-containing carbohydrate-binding protein [Segetibacter koreensis]